MLEKFKGDTWSLLLLELDVFLIILIWLFIVRSDAPDFNSKEEASKAMVENMLGMFGVVVVVVVVVVFYLDYVRECL